MLNVYEQIQHNKIKSGLIISLFTAFILVVSYLVYLSFDLSFDFLIFAFIFSLFSSFASYFWGDKIVLSLNQAKEADRQHYFDYYTVVENLSMVAKIPKPKIYIIQSEALNAFATGRDPNHAVVAVTTGLLKSLNRTQLEGVIAHELSHIKNYDIRLMMIVSVLIGSLSILINIASRSLYFGRSRNDDRENNSGIFAIVGLVLIIFAPLIAQLIQLAISRRREFFADASAVMITRQPNGLIEALQIISQKPQLETASTATASLYIANPFKGQKVATLFSTHPPIEDRIEALSKMS